MRVKPGKPAVFGHVPTPGRDWPATGPPERDNEPTIASRGRRVHDRGLTPQALSAQFERMHRLRDGLVQAEARLNPVPSPLSSLATFVIKSSAGKAMAEQLFAGMIIPMVKDRLQAKRADIGSQAPVLPAVDRPSGTSGSSSKPSGQSESGFIGHLDED